jgi:membrane complex biogenesis BtpA family protein
MSAVLDLIAGGAKPMIGMIQLKPLAGSSRYGGESLERVLEHALSQAALLVDAGFPVLMVQNLGDLPVAGAASATQVAWMTRITDEVRRTSSRPVGLNLLENDVDAMFAVATAAGADFVRIKVYIGAMVTPGGIETGRAFEAIRARTTLRAGGIAIVADIHDRTGVPLASAGLADDIHTAVAIGGADGIVLTGRSQAETFAMLATGRQAFPNLPILVGGGANATNVAELLKLADGAIVSSALKAANTPFGELDLALARGFMRAAGSTGSA